MKTAITPRYSLLRVSDKMIHILDAKHGGLVGAKVYLRTTVNGTGWVLAPMTSTRTQSRKLHATPVDAIVSMRYMTKREAEASLASTGITCAVQHWSEDLPQEDR